MKRNYKRSSAYNWDEFLMRLHRRQMNGARNRIAIYSSLNILVLPRGFDHLKQKLHPEFIREDDILIKHCSFSI